MEIDPPFRARAAAAIGGPESELRALIHAQELHSRSKGDSSRPASIQDCSKRLALIRLAHNADPTYKRASCEPGFRCPRSECLYRASMRASDQFQDVNLLAGFIHAEWYHRIVGTGVDAAEHGPCTVIQPPFCCGGTQRGTEATPRLSRQAGSPDAGC